MSFGATPSAVSSSAVFPNARASGCAKKLDINSSWFDTGSPSRPHRGSHHHHQEEEGEGEGERCAKHEAKKSRRAAFNVFAMVSLAVSCLCRVDEKLLKGLKRA